MLFQKRLDVLPRPGMLPEAAKQDALLLVAFQVGGVDLQCALILRQRKPELAELD